MGNAFLEKQKADRQAYLTAGEQMGFQKCFDFVQLCLRDPRVVGNDVWGKERLKKLFHILMEYDKEYVLAFKDEDESDVKQDHLDRQLKEFAGDDFAPFKVRYPHIKMQKYGGKRK